MRAVVSTRSARVTPRGSRSKWYDAMRSSMETMAAAAAMVSMLERMASYHFDLEPRGVTRADLVETTARILHHTVTGRKT